MSIRVRLVVMCLLIALLPAVPVSILVNKLLTKSFDVGLNKTVETALQSGLAISREHLKTLEAEFATDVDEVIATGAWAMRRSDGAAAFDLTITTSGRDDDRTNETGGHDADPRETNPSEASPHGADADIATSLPASLRAFAGDASFQELTDGLSIEAVSKTTADRGFFWSSDRSLQLAVWTPGGGQPNVLFARRTDPEFLTEASNVLSGRRIFAQLRLAQSVLGRSFFYPFIVIYSVIVIIALGIALFMAERMSSPVRQLADASARVADGDWSVRLRVNTGGEVGRLVDEFNEMVARLDDQRDRLVDMEKMAAWRDIARHLAHEIKNPLLPIRLTVEELKDQYDGNDDRYRGILDQSTRIVGDEIEHLSNLVREFSAFARMPALSPSRGSLVDLVKDVAALYPKLNSTVDVADDVPEFPFDHGNMRRVLTNLYDNTSSVLDEREAAGATVNHSVTNTIRRDGEDVELVFSDRGPGIAPEVLPRIFDPYFTARKGGSGLGLAMVKSIVLLHGGSIDADSVENEGASFTVRLPIAGPPIVDAQADGADASTSSSTHTPALKAGGPVADAPGTDAPNEDTLNEKAPKQE